MVLFTHVEISAEETGPEGSALERVTEKLAAGLTNQTGLTVEEGKTVEEAYEVSVWPAGRKIIKGKPSTGMGNSFEEAVHNAAKDMEGGYNKKGIAVKARRKVEVPYFTVDVVARGLTKEALLQELDRKAKALRGRYGDRIAGQPECVHYRVIHTTADYYASKGIPVELSQEKFVKVGASNESLEAAEKDAGKAGKQVKSTVYEATHAIRIYGMKDQKEAQGMGAVAYVSLAAAAPEVSAPREERRGRIHAPGSPAGRMPYESRSITHLL
ncbi:hypothetical protein HYS48_01635 [Candidatus Woesearchaeota archaeon]|nr:hypothetical protein [Candidatus Woesearchaeota archaeon]